VQFRACHSFHHLHVLLPAWHAVVANMVQHHQLDRSAKTQASPDMKLLTHNL
jgi:hypothetical protein